MAGEIQRIRTKDGTDHLIDYRYLANRPDIAGIEARIAAILTALGGFPVDRGHSDLNAVRTALNLLKEGHVLALFPQGTRSKDNSRTPMLAGVSMIALRSGAPVIPAYIGGPYRPFRKTQLSFGRPVSFEGLGRRVDADTLKAATERIEEAVWGLKQP